jgi:hypothetical protein
MNLRSFLTIAAVIALFYALGSLFMTTQMGAMYGFGNNPSEILLGRFFGVELLVLGITYWLARDTSPANARPFIIGGLIGNLVGAYISVMGTLSGAMNSLGWSSVVVYLLLALGFAYFQFMAPAK